MGRTRKSGKAAAGDAPQAKKIKLEVPKINELVTRFEWEGDGSWIRYSKKSNRLLTDAFNAKKNEVELSVPGGAKMVVKFDKMVQKNKRTGWERRVRLALKSEEDDDFAVLEWQDDTSKWTPYSAATALEIEKEYQINNVSLKTKTTPQPYEINLSAMTQKNISTKYKRKIRREALESEEPPNYNDEDDEPAAESTAKVEEEEEEDVEDVPRSKSGKGRGKSGIGKSSPTKSTVRTLVVKKGTAPVDDQCPLSSKSFVYTSGKIVWDCMLNQTNISNNNNKYYLIQLIQENAKTLYHVWQRWGRVGYGGQTNLVNCGGDVEAAKKVFAKKFRDKTGNDWSEKDSFVKVSGKYDLLKMDYNADDEDMVDAPQEDSMKDVKTPESTLKMEIQELVQLICDVKSMEDAVVEMKYDAKKAPLGKLTKDQIKAGYTALKKIEGLIEKKDLGRNLSDACSAFYTRIPHEFGMQTPPLINTPQLVKKKLELLEALEDIEIAIKMLKGGDMSENPVDRNYHQLKCDLTVMDKKSGDFTLVNKYLQQTHATTHNHYKMELVELFKCSKEEEQNQFSDFGNRMLLWHGSRLTNWAGILGQGLRIAPPEAPVTGYMFGKGVYFADMSSKSANYCFASKAKNIGLLLLCDVSLGQIEDKLAADYHADKLPKGKHSVKGLGKIGPDPKDIVALPDGLIVPTGKSKNTGVNNPHGFTLNYNEYIVYDTKQVRMKYLLKVKFHFK